MKKPGGAKKGAKMHAPHKTGGGPKRKGVRVSGAPVPGGRAPARHHAHHPPGHRMTSPLLPAPHHHRHVKPKQPKKPVKRKLALSEGVACCAAEALAASLRLAGVPVGDEDVLALYWRTAADADAGATISATLEAAERFGLAGYRPVKMVADPGTQITYAGLAIPDHRSLILGVTLPGGPHALTRDPSGAVWSWGELYDLPELGPGMIDEAWAVSWA